MAQFDDLNSFISECQKNVNAIEEYTGCDPLAPWYQYLQWIDENFTIDFKHETIFDQILSACLCKFENDDRYKQDRRLIKLFIKYVSKIHFFERKKTAAFFPRISFLKRDQFSYELIIFSIDFPFSRSIFKRINTFFMKKWWPVASVTKWPNFTSIGHFILT